MATNRNSSRFLYHATHPRSNFCASFPGREDPIRKEMRVREGYRRGTFFIEVGEHLLNNRRIFEASDNPNHGTAASEGLDVDAEDSFQKLCPGYVHWACVGCW